MESEMEVIITAVSRLAGRPDEIKEDTALIEGGYIDSLQVFHVIAELERLFQVRIGAMDATIADFRTPKDILDLVERVRVPASR